MKKICIIDNYDSFTYNIVYLLKTLKTDVFVLKNDCQIEDILLINPDKIILSPGPGSPKESGICFEVIKKFSGKVDILGICLGHQIIAEYFGNKVSYAKQVMHGKVSQINHTDDGIFKGIKQGFNVARYHSLAIDANTINDNLKITAQTNNDNEIMGIQHKDLNIYGVQFHPESFLTEYGDLLISNFINKA